MKVTARELAMKLMENPDLEVVVFETGKCNDNMPAQRIVSMDRSFLDDDDDEYFHLYIEPNYKTVLPDTPILENQQ